MATKSNKDLQEDRSGALRAIIANARRNKSRLLRQLGERALGILTEGEQLEPLDPTTQRLVKEIQRVQRDMSVMEDRLRSLQDSVPLTKGSLPPAPGTDERFPFSR
jgi:hypothetical protein